MQDAITVQKVTLIAPYALTPRIEILKLKINERKVQEMAQRQYKNSYKYYNSDILLLS